MVLSLAGWQVKIQTCSSNPVDSVNGDKYLKQHQENKIVPADYSQIEMRIVGQLARDPGIYQGAYIQGLDLYK